MIGNTKISNSLVRTLTRLGFMLCAVPPELHPIGLRFSIEVWNWYKQDKDFLKLNRALTEATTMQQSGRLVSH